jgi:spoIIIJ-associated protein
MQSVEAEGDSIDAAIDSALQQLGVGRERVEIDILANAARGVLGFGARKARVRATLRANIEERLAAPEAHPASPPTVAQKEVDAPADQAMAEQARGILERIVHLVGVDAGVEVRHQDGHLYLDLTRDDSGLLIGRRGQMLDALEYVLNRIVLKDHNEATRIVVDSQGYRERRRVALEEMALRMAEQARKRRRPVPLTPMSPRDRRTIHLALQNDPTLTTKSSGEGFYRQVVIIPKSSGRRGREQI